MAATRPPKKSETIEIRLSHEMKARLQTHCRAERRTASDVLRDLIDTACDPAAGPYFGRRARPWRSLALVLLGAAFGAGAAVPSLAQDAPAGRAAFDRLDRDHDGALSYREFQAR
jgi:hypothetical protein